VAFGAGLGPTGFAALAAAAWLAMRSAMAAREP
jgi:hypothetical protein